LADTLTDADELRANKRSLKLAQSDYNYMSERSDELYAQYEVLLEEKAARDEEWKFQEQIDAEYDKLDELYPVYESRHNKMNVYWKEYDLMTSDEDRAKQM
jgi:hypothetical protein